MTTTLIYIIGMERSGSTLIHNVLGQMTNISSFGEVKYLAKNIESKNCGCGKKVLTCKFWKKVIEEIGIRKIKSAVPKSTQSRYFLLYKLKFFRYLLLKKNDAYINHIEKLYLSLSKNSDSDFIVDSSKNLIHPFLFNNRKTLKIKVLHIVRDPRGIEYSLIKRKESGHVGYKNHNTVLSTLKWMVTNAICSSLKNLLRSDYKIIKYEDFLGNPKGSLIELRNWLGAKSCLDFIDLDTVYLNGCHSAGGSPSRMKSGKVSLKEDTQWRNELDPKSINLIENLASYYLKKYKYL